MDLGLRQHRRLAAEALDDRAHEGPRLHRGDEHRHLADTRGILEPVADRMHELRQPRGLHGEVAVLALADDRFDEGALPGRRQRDDRQVPGRRRILRADLAGEPGADMLDDVARILERAGDLGDALDDGPRSRIETRSASRNCSTRWMPVVEICAGTISLTRSAWSFGSSRSSFCTSICESSSGMFALITSVRCVDITVAASTTV